MTHFFPQYVTLSHLPTGIAAFSLSDNYEWSSPPTPSLLLFLPSASLPPYSWAALFVSSRDVINQQHKPHQLHRREWGRISSYREPDVSVSICPWWLSIFLPFYTDATLITCFILESVGIHSYQIIRCPASRDVSFSLPLYDSCVQQFVLKCVCHQRSRK